VPITVVIAPPAAAVKQSDVSTSRSRKNIHVNTPSVLSSSAGAAPSAGEAPGDRRADRGAETRSPTTVVANIEIIEFDGREISALNVMFTLTATTTA